MNEPQQTGGWVWLDRRPGRTDAQERLRGLGLICEGLASILDPSSRWYFPVPRGGFLMRVSDTFDRWGDRLAEMAEGRE